MYVMRQLREGKRAQRNWTYDLFEMNNKIITIIMDNVMEKEIGDHT